MCTQVQTVSCWSLRERSSSVDLIQDLIFHLDTEAHRQVSSRATGDQRSVQRVRTWVMVSVSRTLMGHG